MASFGYMEYQRKSSKWYWHHGCYPSYLPCLIWIFFSSTILYLFSYSFFLMYYFPLCLFSPSSLSLASWCWYTFHLVIFNPPLVSLLWCITLCFPFINLTLCGYFHVLFCLITHLWLCRKKQFICYSCVQYMLCYNSAHILNNREKCILNTLNAKTSTCST